MKKVLVLGGISTDRGLQTDYSNGFKAFMSEYEFVEARFDHLVFAIGPGKFSITDGRDGKELSDYDMVIMRGKIRRSTNLAYVVSYYLEDKKVSFFNDYSQYRPSSKLAQAMLFYRLKLPFIETYSVTNPKLLVETVNKNLDYPIILKDSYGSHGQSNYLVDDEPELKKILHENPNIQFIAQAYHVNDCDYRVLVVGNQEPLVIKRTAASGSHLNNTSQGGRAELSSEIPAEFIEDSKKLAQELKMTLAGIDLLQDKNTSEMFFLEVNSQPQVLSGAFVKEKEQLLKKLINGLLN